MQKILLIILLPIIINAQIFVKKDIDNQIYKVFSNNSLVFSSNQEFIYSNWSLIHVNYQDNIIYYQIFDIWENKLREGQINIKINDYYNTYSNGSNYFEQICYNRKYDEIFIYIRNGNKTGVYSINAKNNTIDFRIPIANSIFELTCCKDYLLIYDFRINPYVVLNNLSNNITDTLYTDSFHNPLDSGYKQLMTAGFIDSGCAIVLFDNSSFLYDINKKTKKIFMDPIVKYLSPYNNVFNNYYYMVNENDSALAISKVNLRNYDITESVYKIEALKEYDYHIYCLSYSISKDGILSLYSCNMKKDAITYNIHKINLQNSEPILNERGLKNCPIMDIW